ncbi:MAG: DNA repair protein RadA [Bacteroidota bacterium]
MAKAKTFFFCQNCGYESAKWLGKCPSCQEWNSFVEELKVKEGKTDKIWSEDGIRNDPVLIDTIEAGKNKRLSSQDKELDRVLGGGIVDGSLVLIGGEPGIGKSTLMLQLSLNLDLKILYVSGEESEQQIKLRADRIASNAKDNTWILSETDLDQIFQQAKKTEPELIIIDSIQTLTSTSLDSVAGSVGQVRHCAGELLRYAKQTKVPVFLVGHITKDGSLAGPKVLEHMVDTVLQFEGDSRMLYRLLRTTKNRFGSTSELGIYEMTSKGLRIVDNPSEILISQRDKMVSGVSIGATIEGNRPLMIETQALVSAAAYGTPQRSATGFEGRRLNMLLAVLEKRTGLKLGTQDIFINMAGGIKVDDPAMDLAVCVAVLSSLHDVSLPEKACFAAEVGLGGELRAVNRIESRIAEAEKLGFETIYISKYNKNLNSQKTDIKVKAFGLLPDVFGDLFG